MTADVHVGILESRHFFSGAAVYRDDSIIATLTPVGLAFKVPDLVHDDLIGKNDAIPLRYFAASPVKRNYVLFQDPDTIDVAAATRMILGKHPWDR